MMRKGNIRKRRKTAAFIKVIFHVLVIILFLFMAVFTVYGIVQEHKKSTEKMTRYVSLTEEASAKAYVWLDQLEDMPLSYEDIKQMMGDLQLTVILTPTREKGRYMQELAEDTYEVCVIRAMEGLGKAYRETARHRFAVEGYEEEITDEMLDDMMREAYGLSVDEYLAGCEVQLLPELQELKNLYNVETNLWNMLEK